MKIMWGWGYNLDPYAENFHLLTNQLQPLEFISDLLISFH